MFTTGCAHNEQLPTLKPKRNPDDIDKQNKQAKAKQTDEPVNK